MLDAIDAKELSSQTVMNACQYMVGECSCTVKTQNPGVDLLMSANWSEALGGDTVVIVDSQANLSPQLVEIPRGTPVASPAESPQSGAAIQATEDQAVSDEPQAVADSAVADSAGMDDSSANDWKLRGLLIFVFAGTGIVAIWLVGRTRNR